MSVVIGRSIIIVGLVLASSVEAVIFIAFELFSISPEVAMCLAGQALTQEESLIKFQSDFCVAYSATECLMK